MKLTGMSNTWQAASAVASRALDVNPGSSSMDSSRKYDEQPVIESESATTIRKDSKEKSQAGSF